MGKRKRRIELLAPGGSLESIRAAVHAGADAVYAGGRLFGARAYAENPETGPLLEAIDYCHLHGVKLYLTVNTLLKEYELTQVLPEYLAPIYERGVDAVLVQDFGVFHFLRREFPSLPLHASTQMTVMGPDGAALLQRMGAERVVLSRELSLDEIRVIRRRCDVELETFVHGALCYCYSGKCLMSSLIGGRSGNRGRCAQPCRLPYDLYESRQDAIERHALNERSDNADRRVRARSGKAGRSLNLPGEQFLLSPKDICTLRLLPDLIDAGVTSLKIEGRMKSPEYAAGVTAMYRKYIDRFLACGREDDRVEAEDEALLLELFSRGAFSEGYYRERNGRDMITLGEKSSRKGASLRRTQETVQRIKETYVDASVQLPLRARISIRAGEQASLVTWYQSSDDRGTPANREVPMNQEAPVNQEVPAGRKSEDGTGSACCVSLEVRGGTPSKAQSRPADREMILKQLRRTGNTDFFFDSIDVDLEDGLFVPLRDLNDLRRSALEGIREKLLEPYRRTYRSEEREKSGSRSHSAGFTHHPSVTASVCTKEQLAAVLAEERVGGVYLDVPICTRESVGRVKKSGKKAYLMLPEIWREDTARIVRGRIAQEFKAPAGATSREPDTILPDGVLVRCYDQLEALKESGYVKDVQARSPGVPEDVPYEVIADAGLYTWNREAERMLSSLGVTMDTLPLELSARELERRGCGRSECIVYGYQTLMVSAQCLTKTTTGCKKEPGIRYLKDRKGVLFAVKNDCALCLNTIYNSVPLELASRTQLIRQISPASVRYAFTIESGEETERVLKGQFPDAVTRGHIRKGVE